MRRRGRVSFGRIQRAAGWCEAVPEETELTLEHLTEPLTDSRLRRDFPLQKSLKECTVSTVK